MDPNLGYVTPLYSVVCSPIAPAASASDIFIINGSASKLVRVRRMVVSHYAETAAIVNMAAVRRSTANSGGTSTTGTVVNRDSSFSAPTAVARAYTANPSVGTLVGTIQLQRIGLVIAGVARHAAVFDFGSDGVLLRGVAEGLAFGLGGATCPANTFFDFSADFTEE